MDSCCGGQDIDYIDRIITNKPHSTHILLFWILIYSLSSRGGSIQVSPHSLWCCREQCYCLTSFTDSFIIQIFMFSTQEISVWIGIRFSMSSENAEHGCHCYKNRYSNPPLAITALVPVFHRAAAWQEKRMRWWWVEKGGGIFQLYSICCVIWGLAGVCVCLAGLGSFSLFIVSVHPSLSAPTCPSASRPGTTQCFYCLDTMKVKWTWKQDFSKKIIDVIHFYSSSSCWHSL